MITFGLRRATNIHRQNLLIDKSSRTRLNGHQADDPLVYGTLGIGQEHDREHRRARAALRAVRTPTCSMEITCAMA